MSGIEWSASEPDSESEDRGELRGRVARTLAKGGMEGVQVISHETAEHALTPKRRELLRTLRTEEVDSVRDLARRVDRDKAQVSRDLGILAEHAIISYDDDGQAKRPYIPQEYIFVEPI